MAEQYLQMIQIYGGEVRYQEAFEYLLSLRTSVGKSERFKAYGGRFREHSKMEVSDLITRMVKGT